MRTLLLTCLLASASVTALMGLPQRSALQDEPWTKEELEKSSRRIMGHIEDMRGRPFLRSVDVDVADRETFIAYAKAMEDELIPPGLAEAAEIALKLLGVYPADMDLEALTMEVLEGMVAGFYDPTTDTFFLVEHFPRGGEGYVLSHELTHALDDQYYDLMASTKARLPDTDATLAYRAVVEGSGTNLMAAWLMRHRNEIDLGPLMEFARQSVEGLEGVPTAVWSPLVWTYNGGASFLVRSDSVMVGQTTEADTLDVIQAFENPPRSTEQVLHPEKYWDPEQADEPVVLAFEIGDLPRGWEVRMQDTLGELTLGLVTAPLDQRDEELDPMTMAVEHTHTASAGWGGDRALLLQKEDAWLLLSVSRWDSERDAGEFLGAMSLLLGHIEENARGLLPEKMARRGSAVEATVRYGEAPCEVILEVRCGVTRSRARRATSAVSWRAEQ